MIRFLIYFFPAVADIIIAATLFVCSNRLADMDYSSTKVAMVFASWALVYIISNQLLGHIVTSRNAASLLIASNILFAVTAAVFIFASSIWAIYALMAVLAFASAMFFLPFQIFMKAVEPDQHLGVVRSSAIYTFSWSMGFGLGPFIAGFLYQLFSWKLCFAFTGSIGILNAIGIYLLRQQAKHHHDEVRHAPDEIATSDDDDASVNYHNLPDLAWLGWVAVTIGCLGYYSVFATLPKVGVKFEISKSQIGVIIAILNLVQALVALGFINSKKWMYRRASTTFFSVFGVIALVGFAASTMPFIEGVAILSVSLRTVLLYSCAACYGIFSGSFYFRMVFHSLVHPSKSPRYVAVNESVVGICGLVGPLLAGLLADRYAFSTAPLLATLLVFVLLFIQFFTLAPKAQRP